LYNWWIFRCWQNNTSLEAVSYLHAGTHLAQVNYDIYAEGEAVLGWFNTTLMLQGKAVNWDDLAEKLLKELSWRFDGSKSAIGHVKLLIEAEEHYIIGNLTGKKIFEYKRQCWDRQ
jgi:hypothetical protein